MSITKETPDHGIRIRLTRVGEGYEGTATTHDAKWNVACTIDDADEVHVTTDAPKDVVDRVRLMVRVEVRNAKASGARPPRMIQRWRAAKE